jgi:hypothetical protein
LANQTLTLTLTLTVPEGSGPGPGPAEGFRDPTFSELMRRANLPSSSTATGRRPSADSGRGMGALTQSSPLLGGAGLGTGLGLGMVGQGDPSFAGYLSPSAMPYSGVGGEHRYPDLSFRDLEYAISLTIAEQVVLPHLWRAYSISRRAAFSSTSSQIAASRDIKVSLTTESG